METSDIKTSYLIKRFVPYFKKYRWTLVLDLFCATLTTLCELILPLIMRTITNLGMNDTAALTLGLVLRLGGLYAILRLIDTVANYYMAYIGHVMGGKIETNMRSDAFAHLQKLSHSYYNETKVGQIMSRITNDLFEITEFAHHCPEEFYIAFIKGITSFIILCRINVLLTVIIFLVIPIMLLCSTSLNHKMKLAFQKQRSHIGELNSHIEDSLLGVRVVKAFANEEIEIEKFRKDNDKFLDIKRETYRYMASYQGVNRLFDGLMYLVLVIGGGIFMIRGLISAADIVAYTLYITTLLGTIRRIVEFAEQFQRGMTGIQRFIEIMDADVDIFDNEDAKLLEKVNGAVTFDGVCFEYPDDHVPVLTDINLKISQGEKIALVGPSGGGKTTLCNLIPRFYDPTKGDIYIDGINIKDITLKSLRANIGIVQQDVYLFAGTIMDNILYGKPGASLDEVRSAAKLAGAHEFIERLPDGYNTYVGERGVKLSGGQKQRISIARVFLKNPAILVLDEATSALDNESEFLISQSLEELAKGRTTITIAHRLTTIQDADRILVLADDGIVEEGNHKELLEKEGAYFQLYQVANRLE